jgi:NAD(P)-dependent dehydrogenase (short-subunit alcohol dehydrogenase family)
MSRTIILTGATGKFGKVLVKYFIENGDKVIAIGRSKKSLNKLKKNYHGNGNNLFLIEANLMSKSSYQIIAKVIKRKKLKPDCLINNARDLKNLKMNKHGEISEDNFLNELKLGVVVPYELSTKLVKLFKNSLRNIVNIGSIYGSVVPNTKLYKKLTDNVPISYGVTKAALEHLTKELAVRFAKKKIRVNCVAFGGVEGRSKNEFKKKYSDLCPIGRMLREDEIPGPIDSILSKKTSGMTGHVLIVDGGWSLW